MGNPCADILVIKLRYIGDVILTTPLLRSVRESFPRSRITVLVRPGTESVLQNNPCIDNVVVLPRANWIQQI